MSNDTYQYIGEKIRAFRELNGLTQEALANRIKVSPNTISRWETAAYKPAIDDLEKLAREFAVQIWAFLPSSVQPPTEEQRALLRAAGDLPEEDLEELERYAHFIRARKMLQSSKSRRNSKQRD